ncbi:MAG: helix-turn-helix transcriptional regulator [Mesorhizobium sp.]|nr:helix-turn-helix transcriptional regulator [Mesorhizobium sp.]
MTKDGIHVLIDIAEAAWADHLVMAFEEAPDMDAGPDADADVLVTDHADGEETVPSVLLSDDVAARVHAILPPDAPLQLVVAAARLVAAGYTIRRADAADGAGDSSLHGHDADGGSGALGHGADVRHSPAAGKPPFVTEAPLTAREMQVLALLADGASNKVIARKLDISVHTAKFHVAQVMGKLRARNRTDAISIALREGILMA